MSAKRTHWMQSITALIAVICVSQPTIPQTAGRASKPASPAVTQWRARTPAIERALMRLKLDCPDGPISVLDAFDNSADQLSVALVDFCPGGAYTDRIVAMSLEQGQPVIASIRDTAGKRVENSFLQGASVMHSVDVRLAPEKNAIYDLFSNNDSEGKLADCGVKAFVWNTKTRTFDRNLRLSSLAAEEYCRSPRVQH